MAKNNFDDRIVVENRPLKCKQRKNHGKSEFSATAKSLLMRTEKLSTMINQKCTKNSLYLRNCVSILAFISEKSPFMCEKFWLFFSFFLTWGRDLMKILPQNPPHTLTNALLCFNQSSKMHIRPDSGS